MNENIKELIKKIKNLWDANGYNNLYGCDDGKALLCLYAFYHYFYGDEDYIMEVNDGCDYKIGVEHNVQGCYEPESFDEHTVDILGMDYLEEDEKFDIARIKYLLAQIQSTVLQIKTARYYKEDSILNNKIDSDSKEIINIKILTNYIPSFEEKRILNLEIDKTVPAFDYIKFEVVFLDDILDEIAQLTSDKECVDSGYLILDKEDNKLSFGDENSIIVNVSALSLKENWIKYHRVGLFSKNLRFYIPDKKVDSGIENTIRNNGENFWYYNNGIIIVCDDYQIKDKKIIFTNYSIVNGGQTTSMIGNIPFDKDFYISCKVIKNKYKEDRVQNIRFVSEIAQASNTQKPIKTTDIIANKPEQRMLKEILAKSGIFVQIKRGDSAVANLKENYPLQWQRTKNDEIAQLLYSGIYQKPGTARNSKDKIFSDPKKYNLVFGDYSTDKYSTDLLRDLLFIRTCYKKWSQAISKDKTADQVRKGLSKNSQLFFNACILFIAKLFYAEKIVDKAKKNGYNNEESIYLFGRNLFNHKLFKGKYEDIENRVFELFDFIYTRYILKGFNQLKSVKPELAYSNFTKIDNNYNVYVASNIFDDYIYNHDIFKTNNFFDIFYVETEEDNRKSEQMIDNAFYELDNKDQDVEEFCDEIAEQIELELKEYRSAKAKELGKKVNDIFSNSEIKNISELKPKTIDDLEKFGCFKKLPLTKKRNYGDDIINIIKHICGE